MKLGERTGCWVTTESRPMASMGCCCCGASTEGILICEFMVTRREILAGSDSSFGWVFSILSLDTIGGLVQQGAKR